MLRRSLLALSLALTLRPAPALAVPPTNAQKCEADADKASGKFAQCKLNAESAFAKSGDAGKLSDALAKCSTNLQTAFGKLAVKYPGACPMTEPVAAFNTYLTQCSDDTAAAAGGAALPDYVGGLATCNASLTACQGDLATCEATPPAQLLKTGQTTSLQTGDDGDLKKGITRNYVNNGDGTITDTQTGLMWEMLDDNNVDPLHDKDTGYMWSDAFVVKIAALNAGLGFAGHNDWRLPNLMELQSIVDYELAGPAVSSAFNSSCTPSCTLPACSCTASSSYWSSSNYATAPTSAWYLNFNDGFVLFDGKTNGYYVRAVRGGS